MPTEPWRQLAFGILYHYVYVMESYLNRRETFDANSVSQVITFAESEWCQWLCEWVDFDHKSYCERLRDMFLLLPEDDQYLSMTIAKQWWAIELSR